MYSCPGTSRDPDAGLNRFQFFTFSFRYESVGKFDSQASESVTIDITIYSTRTSSMIRRYILPGHQVEAAETIGDCYIV